MIACDVLIVGAGPAGLTAALYAARFRRSVVVVDDNRSRAAYIPLSRNCPGFVGGISGTDLLQELRVQCAQYRIYLHSGRVETLCKREDGFLAQTPVDSIHSRAVIMATGVIDRLPPMEGVHEAIHSGRVRLCPVCDAFEADNLRVGVFGPAAVAISHARYLRSFSRDVVVASTAVLDQKQLCELREQGFNTVSGAERCALDGERIRIEGAEGSVVHVDVVYPALGCDPNSGLARELGVRCDEEGRIEADKHQQTSIRGVFAIGDVVAGLNQISVATGQAAVAASAVHQYLPFTAR